MIESGGPHLRFRPSRGGPPSQQLVPVDQQGQVSAFVNIGEISLAPRRVPARRPSDRHDRRTRNTARLRTRPRRNEPCTAVTVVARHADGRGPEAARWRGASVATAYVDGYHWREYGSSYPVRTYYSDAARAIKAGPNLWVR
jgi:hypothetical protein